MGIASHSKGFLGLTCCLFVSSGLAAQVAGTKPRIAQNDLPPRTFVIPKDFPEPPIVLPPDFFDKLLVKLQAEQREKQRQTQESQTRAIGWVRWILIGIIAAVAVWGTTQAMRKGPLPTGDTPKTRTEELGLGVDGKDGVWRREVHPWEK
jgi:hypothetical protein